MQPMTRRTLIGSLLVSGALAPADYPGTPPAASPPPPTPPAFATGVTLYVKGNEAEDHIAVRRLLAERAKAGDSAICLVVPFTQDRVDGTRPRADDKLTPAPADLRFLVREATRRGLAVMLKPLMDERHLTETGPAGAWRGTLQPTQPDDWFANYANLLAPWVKLAHDEGCAWFVIGTEFSSLEAPVYHASWRTLIADLRESLGTSPVQLTYGQNWDMAGDPPPWLADLELLSVDAYFPLHGVDDGSPVDALVEAFQEHAPTLQRLRATFPEKPLFFTEVGISSQSGVYSRPWTWASSVPGAINLESQKTFLEAACRFYGELGEGLFWWVANIHPLDDPRTDTGFAFLGKPAEAAVNQCSARHSESNGR